MAPARPPAPDATWPRDLARGAADVLLLALRFLCLSLCLVLVLPFRLFPEWKSKFAFSRAIPMRVTDMATEVAVRHILKDMELKSAAQKHSVRNDSPPTSS